MTTAAATDRPAEPVAEALALSVTSLDAARRVGWAKAFAALDQVEALSKEVNLRDEEIRALRRAYSRLLGMITHAAGLPKSPIFDEEIANHTAAERTFRHEDAWDSGVTVALRHNAIVTGRRDAADAKAERLRNSDRARLFELARQRGHDIRTASGRNASCSCGERRGPFEPPIIREWSLHHAEQAIGGELA